MSTAPTHLGSKLRALRRREGLTQRQMAASLGISASYLNLIEHDRRTLSAPLLIKVARLFSLDLATFGADEDDRLIGELIEVFADPLFEDHGLTTSDARELVGSTPEVARALLTLYREWSGSRASLETLASRLTGHDGGAHSLARLPAEEVQDLVERHDNHFPTLELAAERLRQRAGITDEDRYGAMVRHLEGELGVRVVWTSAGAPGGALRRFDRERGLLHLSEVLPPRSRHFQLAHQLGLMVARDEIEAIVDDRLLTSDEARGLARVVVANAFAGAVLMPYAPFARAAREVRYDVELLGHRYRASFEQVCHRLSALRRPGDEGVRFHMMRVDIAGNLSKRFSGSGIRFARYGGACPRWNVHAAFLTPGVIRTQVSTMPDGARYFCIARTIRKDGGGWKAPPALYAIGLGCRAEEAEALVYADGVMLDSEDAAVPVGVTCRLCERGDCPQRAFPRLDDRLNIDPDLRRASPWAGGGR